MGGNEDAVERKEGKEEERRVEERKEGKGNEVAMERKKGRKEASKQGSKK